MLQREDTGINEMPKKEFRMIIRLLRNKWNWDGGFSTRYGRKFLVRELVILSISNWNIRISNRKYSGKLEQ